MNILGQSIAEYQEIVEIVVLSLEVSFKSTLIATLFALGTGIPMILSELKIKKVFYRVISTLMGMPPVLMGLLVYLLLSRKGILGGWQLLFTKQAMIIAQSLLVYPIILGNMIGSMTSLSKVVKETCKGLGANNITTILYVIRECKMNIIAAVVAGFGRAISEVGAVMMVGGNIKGNTRVMTTYIALETGKGNFDKAIIIGFILLGISFIINILLYQMAEGKADGDFTT